VWVQELRAGSASFRALLQSARVLMHPAILGELACGNLPKRPSTIAILASMPRVTVATEREAMQLIDAEKLHGAGLGWIDVQLLPSARLHGCTLQTRDAALRAAAVKLGVAS